MKLEDYDLADHAAIHKSSLSCGSSCLQQWTILDIPRHDTFLDIKHAEAHICTYIHIYIFIYMYAHQVQMSTSCNHTEPINCHSQKEKLSTNLPRVPYSVSCMWWSKLAEWKQPESFLLKLDRPTIVQACASPNPRSLVSSAWMLFLGPKLQVKDVLHTGWVQQTAGCENGCNLLQHFQNQALNPPGTVIYDHLCVSHHLLDISSFPVAFFW